MFRVKSFTLIRNLFFLCALRALEDVESFTSILTGLLSHFPRTDIFISQTQVLTMQTCMAVQQFEVSRKFM